MQFLLTQVAFACVLSHHRACTQFATDVYNWSDPNKVRAPPAMLIQTMYEIQSDYYM